MGRTLPPFFTRILLTVTILTLLVACSSSTPTVKSTVQGNLLSATVDTSDSTPDGDGSITKDNPPSFAGAAGAQQYRDTTIIFYGNSVGFAFELDQILSQKFTEETGIHVRVLPKPTSTTETYATYQRFFQEQSSVIDVLMLDVIWPSAFAQHLVDLNPKLATEATLHYPGIIENNTIDGKLIAMPWFSNVGMLYYRADLLERYGFNGPPKTWDELEQMAQKIQDGERVENDNFAGYVFQGDAYEGLTCNALEWVASSGGGRFVEQGTVTLNNPQAVAILNKVRSWVGTIAPQSVTKYQEEDARNVFQGGNAAFMRNWPYAYAQGQADDSLIKGKFDVAPLPAVTGQKPVGTVGGWHLAVSSYSKNQDAALEFVRYLTSPAVQTWRAVVGSYIPTIPNVVENPEVVAAMPFLEKLTDVQRVARPSGDMGEHYNEASMEIFQGVNQILNGQDAAQVVQQISQRLQQHIP
jgi:trehalose/maltose transport system substrate-binding protein